MSPTALPYEVQFEIICQSLQPDCRTLRLVCRAWHEIATRNLFQTLHVRSNTQSLSLARKVASVAALRQHVTTFALCVELPPEGVDRISKIFYRPSDGEHLDRVRSVTNTQANVSLLVELLTWNYSFRPDNGSRLISSRNREQILRSVVNFFPNLHRVESLGPNTDWSAVPPLLSQKRMSEDIESVAAHYTRLNFSHLLKAVSHMALTSVSSDATFVNLDGDVRMWMPIGSPQLSSRHISHVKLHGVQTTSKGADLVTISEFLRDAKSLQVLELGLCLKDCSNRSRETFTKALCSISWTKIRHLSLSGFQASEDDLVNFLAAQAASLRTLYLSDLEMPLNVNPEGRSRHRPCEQHQSTGSIVSLFFRIPTHCKLDTVCLSGFFTNRYDEGWRVPEQSPAHHFPPECMKPRIERFRCGRGANPFVSPLSASSENENSNENNDSGNDDDIEYADDSWKWWPDWLDKK